MGDNDRTVQFSQNSVYSILSYISFLCIVPVILVAMKKAGDPVRFHARQGLLLFILEIALGIIGILPVLGQLVNLLGMILCSLLSLFCILQVLLGNDWKIPYLGEWAEKINI
ncbi:MAG: hypothetical protein PHH49_03765 [Candidatus Omnitrophica bacterium]|nr:hypothetical protein [Candidatus Omnitrophota bacterium]